MTFLGPLERLKMWSTRTGLVGHSGPTGPERRETEMQDVETGSNMESRYVFYPFKAEAME